MDIPTDEQLGTEAGFEEFLYLVEVYQARDAIQLLNIESSHRFLRGIVEISSEYSYSYLLLFAPFVETGCDFILPMLRMENIPKIKYPQ